MEMPETDQPHMGIWQNLHVWFLEKTQIIQYIEETLWLYMQKKKVPLSDFKQIARNSRADESLFSKQTFEEII